jgi:hypothetical protein
MTGCAHGHRAAAWVASATEPDKGRLTKSPRQMIFEDKRSGGGYFSRDGSRMNLVTGRNAARHRRKGSHRARRARQPGEPD